MDLPAALPQEQTACGEQVPIREDKFDLLTLMMPFTQITALEAQQKQTGNSRVIQPW